MDKTLTQAELCRVLRYSKRTGKFTWLEPAKGRKKGTGRAGSTSSTGWYVQITIRGRYYLAHNLAWLYVTGKWPVYEVDHKNRVRGDNRWVNLRAATHKQNTENVTVRPCSRSQVKGVHFDVSRQQWQAYLVHHYEKKHLGRFDTLIEAKRARQKAEKMFFTHQP